MTASWASLPLELQCRILGMLPTNRGKLRLRFVSEAWRAAMDEPESHNASTCDVQFDLLLLPPELLRHVHDLWVCASSLGRAAHTLHRLQPVGLHLVRLSLKLDHVANLLGLPEMPQLRVLQLLCVRGRDHQLQGRVLTPQRLPHLQELELLNVGRSLPRVCESLEDFPELRVLRVTALPEDLQEEWMQGMQLPKEGLALHLDVEPGASRSVPMRLPPGMCGCLVSVRMYEGGARLHLLCLQDCARLTSVTVRVTQSAPCSLGFSDLLPPGVRRVRFENCFLGSTVVAVERMDASTWEYVLGES